MTTTTPPATAVYTAVVYENDVEKDSNHDEMRTTTVKDNETTTMLSWFQKYSFCAGLLVGIFVQFSSLGANYYFVTLRNQQDVQTTTATTFIRRTFCFSLAWSMITSAVGVAVLLTLRSLLATTMTTTNNNSNTNTNTNGVSSLLLLHTMEMYAATGALTGVCVGWLGTDLLLGLADHMWQAGVSVAAVLVWLKLLSSNYVVVVGCNYGQHSTTTTPTPTSTSTVEENDVRREQSRLSQPLLPSSCNDDDAQHTLVVVGEQQPNRFRLQYISLVLGSLVGLLIQCSSLGANFMVQQMTSFPNHQPHQQRVLEITSVLWSLVTSSMGIALLLLVRALILLTHRHSSGNNNANATTETPPPLPTFVLHVECFFAVGAVVGLNVAWTVADYVLAMESHLMQSLYTLAATTVWCKTVLYCCGYYRRQTAQTTEHRESIDDA